MSTCNEDKTLTVQCIFVTKNGLLTPDLYISAYSFKKYISVMFYDYFCYNSVAKYLEKKAESLEKLNCSLASETARTIIFQNLGEFMEVHSKKTQKLDKSVKENEESVNFNDEVISDVKRDTKKAENEIKQLKKQILYMETYSRRENVKFVGIPEIVEPFNGRNETNDAADR